MRVRWIEDAVGDLQQISSRIEADRSLALANRICRAIYMAAQGLRRPEGRQPRRDRRDLRSTIEGWGGPEGLPFVCPASHLRVNY